MPPEPALSLPAEAPAAASASAAATAASPAAVPPPPTASLPVASVLHFPPQVPHPCPPRSPLAPPALEPSSFPSSAADADVVFATFFVSPGINPDDYHSLRPDMRFARVLRQSHAHKRVHVAVLTDSATRLGGLGGEKDCDVGGGGDGGGNKNEDDDGNNDDNDNNKKKIARAPSENELRERASVEIFRCPRIDRARMGRNSYCNYAQMIAQIDYLER